jgi:hypothetical protein
LIIIYIFKKIKKKEKIKNEKISNEKKVPTIIIIIFEKKQ